MSFNKREAAAASSVAIVFVASAWLSWRRLGNLIIDGGHELEVPRRMLEGAALYKDVRWYWGPLAPWLDAALYRIFGVSYDTLMWAGIVTAALACVGLYLLSRRFVGPGLSAWVAIAFVVGSAFAKRIPTAIFNFVLPFNFSATYGITLAIWSVVLLLRHVETGRLGALVGSALLAGLVAWTKAEATLAVAAAHALFLVTVLPRVSLARIGAWLGGAAVVVAGYLLAARVSDGHVWHSLVALANPASRFYISTSMGLEQPVLSAVEIGLSAIAWAAILALTRWSAKRASVGTDRTLFPTMIAGLLAFSLPAFLLQRVFFRSAPFAMAIVLAWIVSKRVRAGEAALEGRWREHAIVWAFALAALARVPLRAGLDHYGFYLLPPSLVCVAIGMSRYLGEKLAAPASRRVLTIAASSVLAGFSLGSLLISYPELTKRSTMLNTDRVRMYVDADGPEAAFVPHLSRLPPHTICAAVPEGAGMIFAAGLTPPEDGMTSYIPMHMADPADERRVLAVWERHPPELVLYWGQNQAPVFGYVGFGRDYALEAGHWLAEHYEPYGDAVGAMQLLVPRRR